MHAHGYAPWASHAYAGHPYGPFAYGGAPVHMAAPAMSGWPGRFQAPEEPALRSKPRVRPSSSTPEDPLLALLAEAAAQRARPTAPAPPSAAAAAAAAAARGGQHRCAPAPLMALPRSEESATETDASDTSEGSADAPGRGLLLMDPRTGLCFRALPKAAASRTQRDAKHAAVEKEPARHRQTQPELPAARTAKAAPLPPAGAPPQPAARATPPQPSSPEPASNPRAAPAAKPVRIPVFGGDSAATAPACKAPSPATRMLKSQVRRSARPRLPPPT
jgi:hypothetical protein